MSERRLNRMDIRELVLTNASKKAGIARSNGLQDSRRTVKAIPGRHRAQGLLKGRSQPGSPTRAGGSNPKDKEQLQQSIDREGYR